MRLGAFIGGAALAALVSLPVSLPARAADMTPIGRPIPATSGYIPAQFLWTGFYIGAGIGGGWGTSTFTDPFNGAVASPSLQGFLVGAVSGINYQIGSIVIGAEGDFTGTWANGSATDAAGNNLKTQVFWTASITGRVGVAFDRLLVYGKGGAAFDYDRNTVTLPSTASTIGTLDRAGWTLGGGVEYAVTEHWIGRLEYDFYKFAAKGVFFTGQAGGVGGIVGITLSEFKAIMAYKF
jgi:outer membrane immunogenic protein